jgi:hypothetical protein
MKQKPISGYILLLKSSFNNVEGFFPAIFINEQFYLFKTNNPKVKKEKLVFKLNELEIVNYHKDLEWKYFDKNIEEISESENSIVEENEITVYSDNNFIITDESKDSLMSIKVTLSEDKESIKNLEFHYSYNELFEKLKNYQLLITEETNKTEKLENLGYFKKTNMLGKIYENVFLCKISSDIYIVEKEHDSLMAIRLSDNSKYEVDLYSEELENFKELAIPNIIQFIR